MAWIAVDLDGTLVSTDEMGSDLPIDGSVEAMNELAAQGHRLTVFTGRFNPMPESRKQQLREELETTLRELGFPLMDVWTGTVKPPVDLFIDDKAVTFDGDWPLALAQATTMLQERGLLPLQEPMNPDLPPEET